MTDDDIDRAMEVLRENGFDVVEPADARNARLNRERQQRYRDKQRALREPENVTPPVTKSNAEIVQISTETGGISRADDAELREAEAASALTSPVTPYLERYDRNGSNGNAETAALRDENAALRQALE